MNYAQPLQDFWINRNINHIEALCFAEGFFVFFEWLQLRTQ